LLRVIYIALTLVGVVISIKYTEFDYKYICHSPAYKGYRLSEYFTPEWVKTLLASQGIASTEAERVSMAKVLARLNPAPPAPASDSRATGG